MSGSLLRVPLAMAAVVALLGIGACGGDDDGGGGDGTPAASASGDANVTERLFAGTALDNIKNPAAGKKGGKLTVLSGADVDYIDPGQTYYSYAIGIMNAIHRGLYAYAPAPELELTPDLAADLPDVSEDGRTVTVKLREGVMFSKPVNREVEAKDVKYAIERAFTANVPNGYARAYFGDLVGAPPEPGAYEEIPGIETPDKHTVVFKLKRGTGAALAGALSMPISIPVPKEYAQKFDRKTPSTYGSEGAVYTGPYMVESDDTGKAIGYTPGRRIHLVRNPDYAPVDDFRPAYLDEIEILAGNDDTAVASRRVLSGEGMATGDIEPPARQLKTLLESNKTELSAVPSGGWRNISMDTTRPPFDDINVRMAVIAGFDRVAARQQRGGEAIGPIAEHYIPPGMAGFEESNGLEGWPDEFDFMAKPEGDRNLAAEYFKKAGMSSGKYEGDATVLIIGDNADPDKSIAQITEQQLNEMGFNTKLRLVTRDTMFTKFCNVPKAEVNVCPSTGWLQDFPDPQTVLDVTFNGENIVQTQNSNWPELDVPALNKEMDKAKLVTDPAERAQAWAKVNHDIVAQAPAIPYHWDYQVVAASPNVRGVQNKYSTTWDWTFTSLK